MTHSDVLWGLIEYQKAKRTTMIPWTDLTPRQRIDVLLCAWQDWKLKYWISYCDSGFTVRIYNRTSYNWTALITVKKASNATMKLLQYSSK